MNGRSQRWNDAIARARAEGNWRLKQLRARCAPSTSKSLLQDSSVVEQETHNLHAGSSILPPASNSRRRAGEVEAGQLSEVKASGSLPAANYSPMSAYKVAPAQTGIETARILPVALAVPSPLFEMPDPFFGLGGVQP